MTTNNREDDLSRKMTRQPRNLLLGDHTYSKHKPVSVEMEVLYGAHGTTKAAYNINVKVIGLR